MDELLASFVSSLGPRTTPRSAGKELAAFLVDTAKTDGRDWNALRGGVHICGYENSVPVLFHVHTGDESPATQKPFSLYEDFQDGSAGRQLRNGYYKMFSGLFDSMEAYSTHLEGLGHEWPNKFIEDRVSYYSIMVETIASTLRASRRVQSVGGAISAIAFNRDGIQVDKREPRGAEAFCAAPNTALASFLSD